jgi:hypothetical protein
MQQNPQRLQRPRHSKHRCLGCGRHRAVFSFRGRVRADSDHDLCPRCYRSHRQRLYNWFAFSFRAASPVDGSRSGYGCAEPSGGSRID